MTKKKRGAPAPASCLPALLLMMVVAAPVRADEKEDSATDRAARVATQSLFPFLAAGEISLLTSGRDGNERALRGAGALLAAGAAETLLKRLTRERRPDSKGEGDSYSFPSGHATASFTMAAMVSRYQPRRGNYFYAGATLISLSRVQLRRHYLHDVVAGAGLGYFIGRCFTRGSSRRRGGASQSPFSFSNSPASLSAEAFFNGGPSLPASGLSETLASSGAALSLSKRHQVLLSPRGVGLQTQW